MWLFVCGGTSAEQDRPSVETRLGVANVERVLNSYWRTPRLRAEVDRSKISEEFRRKQIEIADLEKELRGQRFWFFTRRRETEEIQEKRRELKAIAEKEAERAREREKESVEELLTDIRQAAETIGRRDQLTVIFDSNCPHILFLNTYDSGSSDVTDEVIEELNSR